MCLLSSQRPNLMSHVSCSGKNYKKLLFFFKPQGKFHNSSVHLCTTRWQQLSFSKSLLTTLHPHSPFLTLKLQFLHVTFHAENKRPGLLRAAGRIRAISCREGHTHSLICPNTSKHASVHDTLSRHVAADFIINGRFCYDYHHHHHHLGCSARCCVHCGSRSPEYIC